MVELQCVLSILLKKQLHSPCVRGFRRPLVVLVKSSKYGWEARGWLSLAVNSMKRHMVLESDAFRVGWVKMWLMLRLGRGRAATLLRGLAQLTTVCLVPRVSGEVQKI